MNASCFACVVTPKNNNKITMSNSTIREDKGGKYQESQGHAEHLYTCSKNASTQNSQIKREKPKRTRTN